MRKDMLKKLCCSIDKAELNLKIYKEKPEGEIQEGLMTCPQCKRYYPIIYGIPIMTPDEYREKALEAPLLERWGLETNLDAPRTFELTESSRKLLDK